MNQRDFHVLLPTFAADYSGACAALFDLNGTVVIHDPSGCIGNYTAYDEPRAYEGNARILTSALDDMQALFATTATGWRARCLPWPATWWRPGRARCPRGSRAGRGA